MLLAFFLHKHIETHQYVFTYGDSDVNTPLCALRLEGARYMNTPRFTSIKLVLQRDFAKEMDI